MPTDLFDIKLHDMDIAVFDLETSGRYANSHRIIQIALVNVSAGAIVDGDWMRYVNPGADHLPLDPFIVNYTGITDDHVKDQPGMDVYLPEFAGLVGDRVVAGHNVKTFDIKFIEKAEQRHGVDVQTQYYIDTLRIMRRLHPGNDGHKLADCARHYELEVNEDDLHDALVDTTLTAQVMLKQFDDLKARGVETFEDLIDFFD